MARLDGLDVFIEIFVAIVRCLEIIKSNEGGCWNSTSVRDANSLFHGTVATTSPSLFV